MPRKHDAPSYAVIGAGYGEEGKGLLTDALAHSLGAAAMVIRHNGGAQAGHTVTLPDGRRHVFHHVGSGTRHGAGPLAHEQPEPPSPLFRDATNRPNPWQGALRFGRLDLDVLGDAIRADLPSVAETALRPAPRLAVTCLDQFAGLAIPWIEDGRLVTGSDTALVRRLAALVPEAAPPLLSYGPSRESLHGAGLWTDV